MIAVTTIAPRFVYGFEIPRKKMRDLYMRFVPGAPVQSSSKPFDASKFAKR
jgi:hypothetical protein